MGVGSAARKALEADSVVEARRKAAASMTVGAGGASVPTNAAGTPQVRNPLGQMGAAVDGGKPAMGGVKPQPVTNSPGVLPIVPPGGTQPPTQPGTPPAPTNGQYTPDQINAIIGGLNVSGGPDQALIDRQVANQETYLANRRKAGLAALGARSGGGALGAGMVQQQALQAGQADNEAILNYRTNLDVASAQGKQAADIAKLGVVGSLVGQREGQDFAKSERKETQQFTAGQSELDRANVLSVAKANNDAEMTRLETEIAAATARQDDAQASELEGQLLNLKQKDKELTQQESEFARSLGLDEKKYETLKSQFDTTTDEGKRQFNEKLQFEVGQENNRREEFKTTTGLDYDKLKESARQFDLGLLSEKEIETLKIDAQKAMNVLDNLTREKVANIDNPAPGTVEQIATLTEALGAVPGLANLLGGSGGLGGLLPDGWKDPFATGGTGGISNLGAAGAAGLGVAAGAALIYKAFEPGSGRAWDAAAGQFMAGPLGAAFGGFMGFGKSGRQESQDAFTKQFDETFTRNPEVQASMNLPPSDEKSYWNPINRYAAAKSMKDAVSQSAKQGVGTIEISEPDWKRMEDQGLAASVKGSDRSRSWLIDDSKLIAMLGKGPASNYFDFEMVNETNNDKSYADRQSSMESLITNGKVRIIDKVTGKAVPMDNPEIMKRIAERNNAMENSTKPETGRDYTGEADAWFGGTS